MTTITMPADHWKALHLATERKSTRGLDRIWIGPDYAIASDGHVLLRIFHGRADLAPAAVDAVKPFGAKRDGPIVTIDTEAQTITRGATSTACRFHDAGTMPDVCRLIESASGASRDPLPDHMGWGAPVLERVGALARLLGAGGVQFEPRGSGAAAVRMPELNPAPLILAMPYRVRPQS